MSTQRQKKRNAQYRKKHHGQKAREDGGKRGVVAKPSGEPVEDRGRPHAPGSVQEQPPPLPEAASGEGSDYKDKQYSKRKVVSNWDRYSEGTPCTHTHARTHTHTHTYMHARIHTHTHAHARTHAHTHTHTHTHTHLRHASKPLIILCLLQIVPWMERVVVEGTLRVKGNWRDG